MDTTKFCVFHMGSATFLVKDWSRRNVGDFVELVYSPACD